MHERIEELILIILHYRETAIHIDRLLAKPVLIHKKIPSLKKTLLN